MAAPAAFVSSLNSSNRNPYYVPPISIPVNPSVPHNGAPHINPKSDLIPSPVINPSPVLIGNISPSSPTPLPNPIPGRTQPPNNTHNSKSFADLFAQPSNPNCHGISNSAIQTGLHKGIPAVKLSKEIIDSFSKPFKFTLVGKFMHGRPSMEDSRIAFAKFNLKGFYKLGHLDNRHMLIQLSLEEDYQRLFMKEVWYVDRFPMRTLTWSPSWRPEQESPIVPVWIGFPGLPIHLMNKSFLFAAASMIGTPLSLDKATAEFTRPSLAKLLVQLDASKKVPHEIFIDCGDACPSFYQKVEYDNIPKYCKHCLVLGHDMTVCRKANPNLVVKKPEANKAKEGVKGAIPEGEKLKEKKIDDTSPLEDVSDGIASKKVFVAKRGNPIPEIGKGVEPKAIDITSPIQHGCTSGTKVVLVEEMNGKNDDPLEEILQNIAAHKSNAECGPIVEIADTLNPVSNGFAAMSLSPRAPPSTSFVTEKAGSTPFASYSDQVVDSDGFTKVGPRKRRSRSSSPSH